MRDISEPLYLLSEIASELGLTETTVRHYALGYLTPELETIKRGNRHYVRKSVYEAWLAKRREKQAARESARKS